MSSLCKFLLQVQPQSVASTADAHTNILTHATPPPSPEVSRTTSLNNSPGPLCSSILLFHLSHTHTQTQAIFHLTHRAGGQHNIQLHLNSAPPRLPSPSPSVIAPTGWLCPQAVRSQLVSFMINICHQITSSHPFFRAFWPKTKTFFSFFFFPWHRTSS